MYSLRNVHLALMWMNRVKKYEGIRSKAYKDSKGHLTIGIGHNIESTMVPDIFFDTIGANFDRIRAREDQLSMAQIQAVYIEDFCYAVHSARLAIGETIYDELSKELQCIFADMTFNMGYRNFKSFKKMIAAIKSGDFKKAALEMADSKWGRSSHRAKDYVPIVASYQEDSED